MSYLERANARLSELRDKDEIVILAIESSCDETACAILRNRTVLANIIASQIEIHKRFGGVVPEVASRNHTLAVKQCVEDALAKAGMTFDDIDAIAVTYGAGLLGALLVGVSYAKALAYALDLPLIAVNHIKGHIAVNYIACPELEPPYICLIASGGHTAIAHVKDYLDMEIIGETQDDACGEAFDKVARALGLPYPGGPEVEKLAREGQPVIDMPVPFKNQDTFNFSYSGLKTAVINYIHTKEQKCEEYSRADIACSFQERATGLMVDNAVRACEKYGLDTIVIGGGVGANGCLRAKMQKECDKHGFKAVYPPLGLCTDNAVMIASQAYNMVRSGVESADIDLEASATVLPTD